MLLEWVFPRVRPEQAPLSPGWRLDLAYFGATSPAEPRAWHTAWEGRRVPPELVRVTLALASDGSYAWPDEVVRVWAGATP